MDVLATDKSLNELEAVVDTGAILEKGKSVRSCGLNEPTPDITHRFSGI